MHSIDYQRSMRVARIGENSITSSVKMCSVNEKMYVLPFFFLHVCGQVYSISEDQCDSPSCEDIWVVTIFFASCNVINLSYKYIYFVCVLNLCGLPGKQTQ